jgi:hypothetical protein
MPVAGAAPTSPASDVESGDGRIAPRRRVLKGAKIISLNKDTVFDCTIRNMSETGALLILPAVTGVPSEFFLQIPPGNKLVRCKVARKGNGQLGIAFVSEVKPG